MSKFTDNPVIGTLILLVLLYCLFNVNDIDITDIFSLEGFTRTFKESPWIIYLAVAITLYAGYSIYTHICVDSKENFSNTNSTLQGSLEFNDFYQKFIISRETITDSTGKQKEAVSLKPNRFMIFRTKINGTYYYLYMDSMSQNDIFYKRGAVLDDPITDAVNPFICDNAGVYTVPVLLREDILADQYDKFLKVEVSSVETDVEKQKLLDSVSDSQNHINNNSENTSSSEKEKTITHQVLDKIIYPRFPHHFYVEENIDIAALLNPSVESTGKTSYRLSALSPSIAYDIQDTINKNYFTIDASNSILEDVSSKSVKTGTDSEEQDITRAVMEDKKFLCAHQSVDVSSDYIKLYPDSTAPLDNNKGDNEENNNEINTENTKIIVNGYNNINIHHINTTINLHFETKVSYQIHDDKFWMAYLTGFVDPTNETPTTGEDTNTDIPTRYPVGILPVNYETLKNSENKYINGVNYSDAVKLDFEVVTIEIPQL